MPVIFICKPKHGNPKHLTAEFSKAVQSTAESNALREKHRMDKILLFNISRDFD